MKVYLLVQSHKHGNDYYCFSSEQKGFSHACSIMRESLYEFGDDLSSLSDEELWNEWPVASGYTESYEIIELNLDFEKAATNNLNLNDDSVYKATLKEWKEKIHRWD